MTVKVIHGPGLGDHQCGAVIEIEDHRAARFIEAGYVVAVKPPKAKRDKE